MDFRISLQVQDRGIKNDRVNSIRVAKSMIFFNILRAVAHQVTSSLAFVFFSWTCLYFP